MKIPALSVHRSVGTCRRLSGWHRRDLGIGRAQYQDRYELVEQDSVRYLGVGSSRMKWVLTTSGIRVNWRQIDSMTADGTADTSSNTSAYRIR